MSRLHAVSQAAVVGPFAIDSLGGSGGRCDVEALGSVESCGATRSRRVQKSGIADQGMDLKTYFQLFWVPAIASAVLMTLLWAQDGLSGRAPVFLAIWFLLA